MINFHYIKFYFLLRCGNHKEENGLGWRDRQGSVPICSLYYVTVLIEHDKQYKHKSQKGTKAKPQLEVCILIASSRRK